MGQVFDHLTNPAVVSPNGQTQFYSGAPQAGMALAKQAAQTAQGSTADVGGNLGDTGQPTYNNPQPQQPKMVKPSFMQAQGPSGMPNAASPGLSKAGKLVTLLAGGLQGALAGRAAQERTIAESGGHRSGGIGTGFQAGMQAPFQRAAMGQQLQQQQAATKSAELGNQPIETPMGTLPASMAPKFLAPFMQEQGKLGAAQIGAGARTQAAQIGAGGRTQAADITGRYRLQALQAGTAPITEDDIQQYGLPPEFLGKMLKPSDVSSLGRAQNQATTTVQGQSGPALVNKKTGQVRNLGLGNPGMGRPMEVGNPQDPGQTQITTGAQAMAQGAPGRGSASIAVPKRAMEAELPTKIGDQKVGFNTAIQHADLLRQAAKALNNGDVRTLSNLSNRAATEFGDPALTDFNAIANAYNHEVTNVLAKGHITDAEVAKGGGTMPSGANYATIDKVLNSYQSLMKSKMNMLNQQKQSAISQSQPNKKTGQDSLGIR